MNLKGKKARIITVKDYSLFGDINNNTAIITATQNLKKNTLFHGAKCIMSFSDLIKVAGKNIDNKSALNSTELRFIIHKSIEGLFATEKAKTYQNCVSALEELYTKLILNDITVEQVENINFEKYTFVEQDIFEIYKSVYKTIESTKQSIYKSCVVKEAIDSLSQYDSVAFVGFVFFNDMQEAIIKGVQGADLVFINKDNDFIEKELIAPLMRKIGLVCEVESIEKDAVGDFCDIEKKLFTKEKTTSKFDNQVQIYEPFSNREDEFLFIAKEISKSIRQRKIDINNIENDIQNYAVVLTKDKDELSKTLNDALGQYGVFIPSQKGLTNMKPVYYSKQEFLDSNIQNGRKALSYIEKVKLFDTFKRIKVSSGTLQCEDLPIGRFILEVYKVVANDLTIDSFKTLINTQWHLNKSADTDAIQDFYKLEVYFENLVSMAQWKQEISRLIELKKIINKESGFEKHPLYIVSNKSLKYISDYLEFLDSLVEKLKIEGNVKAQIKHLIKTFNLTDLKLTDKDEQAHLDLLVEILKSIESSESTKIDYKYFAEHIKELIDQYSFAKQMDNDAIKLPVVNMENCTKYDYVYFPMFEDNKYPRVLSLGFPFTDNIVSILGELGLGLQKNQEMAYHLKMSRHIFKNVFGFVNKQITFTYTAKENGTDVGLSIYAHDIFKTINRELLFKENADQIQKERIEHRELIFKDARIKEVNLNELLIKYMCPKLFFYNAMHNEKLCYKDAFLLNFYAKAIITNRFFINLAKTNKEYSLNTAFEDEVEVLFNQTFNEVIKYFNCFSENVKKDIWITSKQYVNDFIKLHFKQGKFAVKQFRFKLGKEKVIKGSFIVKTRPTLIMINIVNGVETEFDISKNLDYLVSSSGGKKYDEKHFADIIERLQRGTRADDKIALVNFASFKVNTQLNNAKYYQDGVERVKGVIEDTPAEYSNMGDIVSSYCRFCKMKSVCKGVLIDD